eukprot:scaffold3302_cov335-Prasinococcus_capsulatus_cf.AAC.7
MALCRSQRCLQSSIRGHSSSSPASSPRSSVARPLHCTTPALEISPAQPQHVVTQPLRRRIVASDPARPGRLPVHDLAARGSSSIGSGGGGASCCSSSGAGGTGAAGVGR